MPELPEVETVRRGLLAALEGRVLVRVLQRRPDLRIPFPQGFVERLQGRRIVALRRRAKYLLADLDNAWTLIAHLGMSGRFTVEDTMPSALDRHDHVVFETDRGQIILFNDARRFGLMDLVGTADLDRCRHLAQLGPEPLDPAFTGCTLLEKLDHRATPIKVALLDQSVVAGIGNIYASEALFQAGIAPDRPAATLTPSDANRLVAAIRDVLTRAIDAGGSSLRTYRNTEGGLGYFQHAFAVYGRDGQPCPGCTCDPITSGGIRRQTQAGRATYYCPRRQH